MKKQKTVSELLKIWTGKKDKTKLFKCTYSDTIFVIEKVPLAFTFSYKWGKKNKEMKKPLQKNEPMLVIEKFVKGRDCLRCGASKPEIKKYKILCNAWGESWDKHLFK